MLTHGTIEKAVREGERVRLNDGDGLMLAVSKPGRASWMLRVQAGGRRRDYGLGSYRALSLSDARHKAREIRETVKAGGDPTADKRRPSMPTLSDAARAVIACKAGGWRSPKHAKDWAASLEHHAAALMPAPVDTITRADVLTTLEPLWETKPDTARVVRQRLRAAFGWAQAYGHVAVNPAGEGIDAALPARPRQRSHYAALHHADVGAALRAVDASAASESARLALRFLTLTAVRSGEARGATWGEIDADGATWTIPASRMKAGREHRVPLSRAALAVLKAARGLDDGSGYVFPSPYGKGQLDGASLRNALTRAGVSATVHGMRSAFRTWASETGQRWDAAETALAHSIGSDVERSYQRSDLLEARRSIMEAWAATAS